MSSRIAKVVTHLKKGAAIQILSSIFVAPVELLQSQGIADSNPSKFWGAPVRSDKFKNGTGSGDSKYDYICLKMQL